MSRRAESDRRIASCSGEAAILPVSHPWSAAVTMPAARMAISRRSGPSWRRRSNRRARSDSARSLDGPTYGLQASWVIALGLAVVLDRSGRRVSEPST